MTELQTESDLMSMTQQVVGDHLGSVERVFAAELESENPFIKDIYQHTSRFRGKRLRPILCLLTAEATGGIHQNHHILAAAIEMIHTATLLHDDVLDNADIRRHVATVNVRWNNETSVMYGDFLFTHAFHLTSQTGSAEACRIIGEATNKVCEGELTQIRNRGNLSLTEEEYLAIINGKTAELCAVATRLGAKFAGASQPVIDALELYGRKLGQAFQVADDVLDLVGLEQSVGKTLGTDLDQLKLTLPIIRFLNNLNETERLRVTGLLEAGTSEARLEISRLLGAGGFIEEALSFAKELAEEACAQLSGLPPSRAKSVLEQMPLLAVDRRC